jgi:predicted nuclease of predicted toxin-antitoxin system
LARVYFDNDVALPIASLFRADGHDAVTPRDLNREDATDDEHLLAAAGLGRTFVTHNEDDFTLLHDAWLRWTSAWHIAELHPGIVIVPRGRRFGVDWGARQLVDVLSAFLQTGPSLSNQLYRRKGVGWEQRYGKGWVAAP